jgi:ABC-2 type transport system ATP-binding protein
MLLQTERLTKEYGSCRALDHLDLVIKPGEIFGLLGPNGSGKSTALRILLGFLRPTSGEAWIDGHDCWRQSVRARRQVGYLPGELRLYENMTGRQLVRFLGQLRKTTEFEAEGRLARAFDIDLDRPIAELSSGMKRKVALLLVLLPRTPLVILDEPTNTLDPTMRDELLDQLATARTRGQAVLFSSHVLAEVERICDRVGVLQKGRLVHVQEVDQLRQIKRIRASFPANLTALPDFPGIRSAARHEKDWTFEYAGPLKELLSWLAGLGVLDLKMEPLGLAGIYQKYHGNGA